MKKMKRFLACFLSVCLLAGSVELPVMAVESTVVSAENMVGTTSGEDVSDGDVSPSDVSEGNQLAETVSVKSAQVAAANYSTVYCVHVNPMYEDEVTEKTLKEWEAEACRKVSSIDLDAQVAAATDYDSAVDELTAAMVARQAEASISIKVAEMPADFQAYFEKFIADAYAEDPAADADEGDYLYCHYKGAGGGVSTSSGGGSIVITFNLTLNYRTTAAQEQAVTERLNELYPELNLGVLSWEAKVGKIYDWVTNHVTYDYEHLDLGAAAYPVAWTAYGGLIDGTCVCQGYASLTYRMMKENGIPVRVITGTAGGAHAWNIVAVDGLYYNIDSTWDSYTVKEDGSVETPGQRTWYLLSTADFGRHYRADEYLTTEFMTKHPMAALSYGASESSAELIEKDNVSYTFATTGSGTVSTTANSGECSIFVFGRVSCGYTQNYIEMLRDSGIPNNSKIRCVLVDIDSELTAVQEYETELDCEDITVCYGKETNGSAAMWKYARMGGYSSGSVGFPIVAVIDGNNKVRYAEITAISLAGAKDCLQKLLGYTAPAISNTTVNKDGVTLTWNAMESVAQYYVYFASKAGAELVKSATTTATTYTYPISEEGTFYFAVSAEYEGIESPVSEPVTVTYKPGVIKEVTLDKTTASIFSYETTTLAATVTLVMEGDVVDSTVTWSSSDETVVTVANGKLTGVKPGTATITATSAKDATKKATCTVTVKNDYTISYELNGGTLEVANPTAYNPYYPALTLNKPVKENNGFVGWYRDVAFAENTRMEKIPAGSDYGNFTLYAKWFECVAPEFTNSSVSLNGITLEWNAVAEADSYCVYRKAIGEENFTKLGQITKTTYTDKVKEGGTYSYAVTAVYDGIESGYSTALELKYDLGMPKEVVLSQTEASIFSYEELVLTVTVNPIMEGDKVDQTVIWTSSDDSVVAVDGGKITGVKPGAVTITATSVKDATKKAACTVTVKNDYTIQYELNGGTLANANPAAYNPFYPDLVLHEPEKADCAFVGWYRDAAFAEDTRMENIPTGSDFGDIVLYARWKEKASVSAPVASIPSGTEVEKGTKVKLSSDTLDAVIYYTLDGTAPSADSTRYVEAITIDEAVTIRAFAVKTGLKDSAVSEFVYTVADTSSDWGDVLPEDIPENGIIPEGLWVAGVEDAVYTGKAITFDLHVYHGKKRLAVKTDYTVSYKNNKVAAGINDQKAPTVTITGKGNYKDKVVKTFTIERADVETTAGITINDVLVAYNGKVQKAVPVVYHDGKKLKVKKDYTVSYPDESEGAYINPNYYSVIIAGTGNYCGTVTRTIHISDLKQVSKLKINAIPAQPYNNGEEIKPEVVVKDGKNIVDPDMYSVVYLKNREVGTAIVRIIGDNVNYVGEKTMTFKITGVAMSKVKVENLAKSMPYTGKPVYQDGLKLTYTAKKGEAAVELVEDQDYTVVYSKNENAGTATITFKGMGRYTGTIKKTFKITPYEIKVNEAGLFAAYYSESVSHAKGGAKPEILLTFDEKVLVLGKDYTVTYKNNKAVNDGSNAKKAPAIVVKGKGNFKGTVSYDFRITKQDMSRMDVQVADKLESKKAGAYKSTPKVYDVDGKQLKAGTDYEKAIGYYYDEDTRLADGTFRVAGEAVGSKDIVPAGTVIRVEITGKGNYEADVVCGRYRIVSADISKATVKIGAQVYTGKEIELEKNQITVTLKGVTLNPEDYEVLYYKNNVKKGTATVVLRGVGKYGGTKSAKFTILSKPVGGMEFCAEEEYI